jgi:hypothetical protein
MSGGTSVSFLKKRLADLGRHDLLTAVENGRISAYTAAEAADLVVRRPVAGGGSTNAAKRRAGVLCALRREGVFDVPSGELGPAELMELQLGPGQMGSRFRTREELHRAWLAGRDELLQRARIARRPQAYYEFEWPHGPRPRYDVERSTLWKLGVLSAQERVALEAEWRREWDLCHAPDFAIAQAWPDGLLEGRAARTAHLEWADVPMELRRRWRVERRRGKRLKTAADAA